MPYSDATGVRVHYLQGGEGAPLLVLQGFGDTASYVPRAWLHAIENNFVAIRVDNRGTGGSDAPIRPFSIEDLADDAVGVLDAAKVDRAHVCGHSMGGMIAQAIALRHPDRINRLVLEATAPSASSPLRRKPNVDDSDNAKKLQEFARFSVPDGSSGPAVPASPEAIRSFFCSSSQVGPGFFESEVGAAAVSEMVDLRIRVPGPSKDVLALQRSAVAAFDVWDRLGDIHAPTLVVHPELDLKPQTHAEAIVAGLSNGRLEVIAGAGHTVRWEVPDTAASYVIDFLTA